MSSESVMRAQTHRRRGVLDSFGGATPIDLAAAMGAGSFKQVVPVISINIDGIGEPLIATDNNKNLSRQWNLVDTVSVLNGHHSLKFGVDFRHIKSVIGPPEVEPYGVFEQPQTILTGTPDIPLVFTFLQATPLFHQVALFAQDEWRAHARLSLSFGLRWEVTPPPTEQHGNDALTLRGSIGDPATLTVAPRGTSLWKTDWYDLAPRLGLAYIARNQPGRETVLRAGGGVFFDSANQVAANGFSNLGFSASASPSNVQLPFTPGQLDVPITVTAPYTSAVISAFPEHLQMPYTLEWNLSVQQALGKEQTLTVSYVAAAARRLLALQQLDLSSLNPDFGSVQYLPSGVTSNYQALQLQFQRSVAKGIQALASYTWSHTIDVGSQATETVLRRGNADFDVRNSLQAGLSWDLPAPRSTQWQNRLISGWGCRCPPLPRVLPIPSLLPVEQSPIQAQGISTVVVWTLYRVPRSTSMAHSTLAAKPSILQPLHYRRRTLWAMRLATSSVDLARRRSTFRSDAPFPSTTISLCTSAQRHSISSITPTSATLTRAIPMPPLGLATQMLSSSLGTMASQYQQGGPRSMQFALRLTF